MKTIEVTEFDDKDGDSLQIDVNDTHTEILIYHDTGAWPCDNPETLRALAAQLIKGAEALEAKL